MPKWKAMLVPVLTAVGGVISFVIALASSVELSIAFGALRFRGYSTNLLLYAFKRSTLRSRLSSERLRRRLSTAMPIVRATLGGMPASFSSSNVKPLPSFSFLLYRAVCPRTTGRRSPAAGRGNSRFALSRRAFLLRCFRAGWSNHVLMFCCAQQRQDSPISAQERKMGIFVLECRGWHAFQLCFLKCW